ncbi:MAG TPA: PIN domain-containing protein [Solirubrobacterales bacterium]|nr:PIN domain-containing protein [Solirubrobacterales bacterium]
MAVILDSNAVIAFLDRGDALHRPADAIVRKLLPAQRLLASVVTYAEVLAGAKLGHHGEDHVRAFFADLISAVVPVDFQIAEKAAGIRAQSKALRMPDALILATADAGPEIDLVVTGDARAAKVPGLQCRTELLRA